MPLNAQPELLRGGIVNKHAKRVRTMFKEAIKARIVTETPCGETRIGGEVNPDRDYIVSLGETMAALTACPTSSWRAIFALARFGGLRACEVAALT